MVGPKALCAPEQFEQTKTPKSNEAPRFKKYVQVGEEDPQSAHLLLVCFCKSGVSIFACYSKLIISKFQYYYSLPLNLFNNKKFIKSSPVHFLGINVYKFARLS